VDHLPGPPSDNRRAEHPAAPRSSKDRAPVTRDRRNRTDRLARLSVLAGFGSPTSVRRPV
jgi:hypothetical protein